MKNYDVIKNIDKVLNYGYTGFLNKSLSTMVKNGLKKDEYLEYIPFNMCDKTILYNSYLDFDFVSLYKIKCKTMLKHSSILGSIFSLNVEDYVFGDIIYYNGNWYVYLLKNISEYIINNIYVIDNYPVYFEEVDVNYLNNFERDFDKIELIVSSLRIDNVISKLIGTNRDNVKELLDDGDILINYDSEKKHMYNFKESDIFSIRRYGKYIFKEILGKTKKDNFIILIYKYK